MSESQSRMWFSKLILIIIVKIILTLNLIWSSSYRSASEMWFSRLILIIIVNIILIIIITISIITPIIILIWSLSYRSASQMWFSRLSPGSDIQTLHLTPSSTQYSIGEKKYLPPSCTQYSIGDIYSEYSIFKVCI